MTWMRIATSRPSLMAGVMLMGVVGGLLLGMPETMMPTPLRAGLLALTLAAAVWIGALYWRSLDEVAREAQKSAWLWGGTAGLFAGAVAVTFFPTTVARLAGPGASVEQVVAAAGHVVIGLEIAGFLVGWAIWWWRRR